MSKRLQRALITGWHTLIGALFLGTGALLGIIALLAFALWMMPPPFVVWTVLRISTVVAVITGIAGGARAWNQWRGDQ